MRNDIEKALDSLQIDIKTLLENIDEFEKDIQLYIYQKMTAEQKKKELTD